MAVAVIKNSSIRPNGELVRTGPKIRDMKVNVHHSVEATREGFGMIGLLT